MDEQSLRHLLSLVDNEDLSEHGFVTCSNALLELEVKNVDLPEDLRILLQYKLTRYAMKYLAGPMKSSPWSEAVDRIQDLFQQLQGHPYSDSFSVDDESLLLFKLIHNELWCLERVDSEQLQVIPLKEVAFCLALFLLMFKLEDDFKVYRLVLNRCSVMEFLEGTVAVLQKVKLEGVSSPGDYNRLVNKKQRKVFKRLAKVYAIFHRLYYLQNIQQDISAVIESDVDETIRNTSMDRLLYKFKLHEQLLSVPLDLREHSIVYVIIQENLVERGKAEGDLTVANDFFKFYQTLYQRLPILETIFNVGIFLLVHKAHRYFLKISRSCSGKQLISLLNFVDLKAIESDHMEMYQKIIKFYETLENHLYLQNMIDLQDDLQRKLVLLQNMKSLQISSIYFSNLTDIDRIVRMVNLDLGCSPVQLVEHAIELWKSIQPEIIIFDLLEQKLKSSILVQIIESKATEPETISEEDINSFENMDINELINSFPLIQADVFETYTSNLKPILEHYNCGTIQELILNHANVPRNVIMVLNQRQMTFYAFLESSKRISNCLELILHGYGGLCSTIYYDFLKDENPNFLTVVYNEKLSNLVNALVLTEIHFQNITFYQKRVTDYLKDIRSDGLAWNQQQKKLLQAALNLDFKTFHELITNGSKSNGKFWYQPGILVPTRYYDLGTILAYKFDNPPTDLCFKMMALVDFECKQKYQTNEFRLQLALNLNEFERAIKLCPKEVTRFPDKIFSWNGLIKGLISAGINPISWSREILSFVVNKLITFVNLSAVEELMNLRTDFITNKSLILKAISTGSENLFKMLIALNTNFDEEILIKALERNYSIHSNFKQLDENLMDKFVTAAIKSNNIESIKQIFESIEFKSLANQALTTSISYNRIKICKHFMLTFPQLNLDSALFKAVLEKHWKLANIFLKFGANPHFRANLSPFVVFGIPIVTAFQVAVFFQCSKFVKKCFAQVEQNQDLNLLALAAAGGSIKMVKHLLRVGFKVIFDNRVIPITLGLRRSKVLQEIVQNIQLNVKVVEKCCINEWINLLEILKYLYFLHGVMDSQEFLTTDNVEFQKIILRRITLYKRLDDVFSIEKFNIDDDQLAIFSVQATNMQQMLETLESSAQKRFNFELFCNEKYAFVEINIIDYSICGDAKIVCESIFIDEDQFSFDSIHDRIVLNLKKSFKFKTYSCDLKIFNKDSSVQRFLKLQVDSISFLAELKSSNYFSLNLNQNLTSLMQEISTENRLQLAVGSGDVESAWALITKIGHSDQQDLWMDPSLFHKVVDYDGKLLRRSKEMIKVLLDAGMPGWKMHPKTIQGFINYALSKDRTDFAESVLGYELPDGLSEEQKMYKILRYGSLQTMKLCLERKIIKESHFFVNASNALLELDIRGVPVGEELQTFLLHKLATHGFNYFCGDPATSKSPTEWLDSLKFVVNWSNELLRRSDCNSFLAIDNEVLFMLKMIHNQLHLIKDKIHFKQLPLKEVMFLLAIFISSVKDEEYEIYRMVLNKSIAMKFVKFIAPELQKFENEFTRVSSVMKTILNKTESQDRGFLEECWLQDSSLPKLSENVWNKLASKKNANLSFGILVDEIFGNEFIDLNLKMSGKSMKMIKFTSKLYLRVRQMYSLNKVFTILDSFSPANCTKEVTVASMKRFVQIFGESIKNTANSMNLPVKLDKILTQQLSAYVKHNKQTRDLTCHDFPLAKKHFSTEDQYVYYQVSVEYLEVAKVTMSILLICTTFEFTRCLIGSLRSCKSLESVQNLIRFVGEQSRILLLQEKLLKGIKKYHQDIKSMLDSVQLEELTKSSKNALERLKINHSRRTAVITHLETMIISKFFYKYHELQVAAFSAPSVAIFHRMLQMNLNHSSYGYLPLIHNEWVIQVSDLDLLPADIKLPERNSSSLAKVQIDFEINQKIAQDHHCQDEVKQICAYFFEGSEISDLEKDQLESQLYQKLQGTKGKGYFGNIFAIDAKVQAIGQVFKQKKLQNFEQKVKDLRERDVADLEEIFKGIQRSILRVLEKHRCDTIDNMIINIRNLPTEVILAIEYWMLEMCEILITTKQFQDNYHTIKQDIQMICGRNFRNYLAHDSISYDLLTNSSRVKVLVNALVMATKVWKIFGAVQKMDIPTLKNARSDGLLWIKSQEDLKQSVLNFDLAGVQSCMNEGALLCGSYWVSQGLYDGLRFCNLSELLLHEHYELFSHQNAQFRAVATLLSPEASGKWKELASPTIKIESAMSNGQFQKALSYAECFWSELLKTIEYKFNVKLFLGGLLEFLDESGDISTIFEVLISWGPELLYVLLAVASEKVIDFILERIPKVRDYAQQHAIIARRNSQEYLEKLILSHEADPAHLTAAAISANLPAFKELLQTRTLTHNQELVNTLLVCSKFGRSQMIRLLLERFPTLLTEIDKALKAASEFRRWKTALLLLEQGANPWWKVNPKERSSAELAVGYSCLKILKSFLKVAPQNTTGLVSIAAGKGSVRMMEALLDAGFDICQDQRVLSVASTNTVDKRMMSFVESKIFNVAIPEGLDPNLSELLEMLQELKIRKYFDSTGDSDTGELAMCLRIDQDLFHRILSKLDFFSSIEVLGSTGSSKEDFVKKCASAQNKIFQMLKPPKVVLKYQTDSVCVEYTVFGSSTGDKFENICLKYSKYSLAQVRTDLPELLKDRFLPLGIDCKVTLFGQLYRILQIDSQSFFMKICSKDSSIWGSLLNAQNSTGQTILHQLPSSITFDIFEQLISRGADLSILDHEGNSALFTLLQQTMPWSVLHQIFTHAAHSNPNLLKVKTHDGTTLLSQAASMCKLEAVRFLLDHGADQSIQAHDGSFPLYNAVIVRSAPIVKALLLAQDPSTVVNIRRSENWETALFAAAGLNNTHMVQLLLDSGADCTLRDVEGFTVVAKAIVNGSRDSLKVLLEHGKRSGIDVVNNVAPANMSALHIGLVKDNVETFQTVLEFLVGGPIDDGLSPKSLAKLKKILQLNDYLMGFTILTAATLSESHKIVAYLNQVIAVYNRLTNEELNVGGVPILPGFSQDMFLSGGNIGNDENLLNGGIIDPEFLRNISELENMSRDLEQMLQGMNILV